MDEFRKVIDSLDSASDMFDKVIAKSEKKIFEEAVTLLKDMDLDANGRIKQSIANLKRVQAIKAKLEKICNNKDYLQGLAGFVQYFDVLQKEQEQYFIKNFAELTLTDRAKDKRALMKQIAVDQTIEALSGTGLQENVTGKLSEMLLRAVTSNEKFADLQEEFRAHLLGSDGGTGALTRYASTYAVTAMSQFTGQNNKLLTDDLGLDWFMYVGSNIETTREFCQHLTKKKYIHRSEIPEILKGHIDGHKCDIYQKTGLPYGLIEGTNEDNFQVNCGGWNCRHQLVPVHELAVPADIRAKFENKEEEKKPSVAPMDALRSDAQRIFTSESDVQTYVANAKELQGKLKKEIEAPMAHEKADSGATNPHYGEKGRYTDNCATCVPSYELRRRGFDLQARDRGVAETDRLSSYYKDVWRNLDGSKVRSSLSREWIKNEGKKNFTKRLFREWIDYETRATGRYELRVQWKNVSYGHVIVLERRSDGSLLEYDPQSNKTGMVDDWYDDIDRRSCSILRIDDKIINPEYAGAFLPN